MTYKGIIGTILILCGMGGGTLLACLSHRIRSLFFMMLVFFAPMLELMSINFVSRDFYRGTSRGFEVSIPDILAFSVFASCMLAPVQGRRRVFWPASLTIMLIYFAYAVFNVSISDPRIFGYFELFKMLRGFLLVGAVAFYVRSEKQVRQLVLALALLVCFEGLLALKQRYVDGEHRVPGTIDDSNSLSVFFCMTAPIFPAVINSDLPRYLKLLGAAAIALAGVGEILTISRAGVVIIALVLLLSTFCTISYRISFRKIAITFMVLVMAGGVLAKSWKTLKARFESSNFQQEYENKKTLGRGYYIRIAKAITQDRFFGVGLNNWSYWVSQEYGPKQGYRFVPYNGTDRDPPITIPPDSNVDEAQAAPAHCIEALTAGELGIPGLVLFLLVWARWFQIGATFLLPRTPDPMRRLGVGIFFGFWGIFLQSLTEWVFRQSPVYYVFHILLGALVGLYFMKKHPEAVPKGQRRRERRGPRRPRFEPQYA